MKRTTKLTLRVLPLRLLLCIGMMFGGGLTLAASVQTSREILNSSVTLQYKATPIGTVLKSIETQSGLQFFYSNNVLDADELVSISAQHEPLKQVLDELLKPRYNYHIESGTIVITKGMAQETNRIKVQGTVVDDTGEPVIGAIVKVVQEPSNGISTGIDGDFTLNNVPTNATLRISCVGMKTIDVPVNGQTTLAITLYPDTELLDELVVVGYGVQKKSVVTGAISQITSDDMSVTHNSRVEDVLKGKVSGVQITQSSGHPGSDSKVRIRGIGTINNSEPLYIVDGMEVGGGIDFLNPADIASVEILKDAASAAIYGARAANGVVLVTTKNGVAEAKPTINYQVSYGWQNPWKYREVLNATEYMVIMNERLVNDGQLPLYSSEQIAQAGEGTNWQKETFYHNAPVQSHQLSVSGGSKKINYFLSGGYFNQAGIVGGNYDKANYERLSLRSNATYEVFEALNRSFLNKIRVGLNAGYSRVKSTGVETNSEYGSILGSALAFNPALPVYANEEQAEAILKSRPYALKDKDGRVFTLPPDGFQEIANPLGMLHMPSANIGNSDKLVASLWGEVDILPQLKFKSTLGIDLAFWGNDGYTFPYFLATMGKDIPYSSVSSSMNRGLRWQVENFFTYNQTFADVHNLSVVLGQSASKYAQRNLGGTDRDLLETDPTKANINSAIAPDKDARVWGGTGGFDFLATASYFGRIDYNYAERYMLQATVRRDGSSNFGPENKWGTFPSVSLGWNLTNEEFMQDRPSWMDSIKLRFSWGQNGNDRIGQFLYTSLMNGGQNYYFGGGYSVNQGDPTKIGEIDGSMQYGSSPARIPNPKIMWEQSEQIDAGVDVRLFSSALTFSFDYFVKNTKGMLMNRPIPGYVGMEPPVANVGDMTNSGLEFELGWQDKIGDFNYSIIANASYLTNRLVDIGNATGEAIYESMDASGVGSYVKGMNNEVFPYFYGFKTAGIFQNEAEVQAYTHANGELIQPNARPGDVRFVDLNGDGKITDADKTKIGKGMPDWTYGLTFAAEWRGIDLNIFFQGTFGNDIFDYAQRGDIPAMNRPAWILDRWHGEGTSNRIPRMTTSNPNSNWRSSDLYIKDGSYLRIKSTQLGYTLPSQWLDYLDITSLRLFISADNLLTFTKYDGFDPEIASGGYTTIGVDKGIYPQARTISIGANLVF